VASSGPITVGIPGLIARWFRSRPLVFEVRDLWPEGAIQLGFLKSRLAIKVARWFERRCYGGASVIVTASDGQARWIARRNPVAEKLVITLSTVKWHSGNIYGKLGVKNRTQAVAKAHQLGILDIDE